MYQTFGRLCSNLRKLCLMWTVCVSYCSFDICISHYNRMQPHQEINGLQYFSSVLTVWLSCDLTFESYGSTANSWELYMKCSTQSITSGQPDKSLFMHSLTFFFCTDVNEQLTCWIRKVVRMAYTWSVKRGWTTGPLPCPCAMSRGSGTTK